MNEGSFLTEVALPLILGVIMFGMGMSLTLQDFKRLFELPKPIFAGLLGQLILLPLIAYGTAVVFDLPPPLAIGLMILSACPGGTMSNVISHLARANLALSVTLTAITTFVCVFTTPWIIAWAIHAFGDSNSTQFSMLEVTAGLFFVTLLPVALGIAVRHFAEDFALKTEVFFRRFSLSFLVAMVVAIVIQERETLAQYLGELFFATLALNIVAIVAGVITGLLTKLRAQDTVTLGIEVGIQNASMAMLIAITFLQAPSYATSAGIYGLTMYIGTLLLVVAAKVVNKSVSAKD